MKTIALCSLLLIAPFCAAQAAEEPLVPPAKQQTVNGRYEDGSSSENPDLASGSSSADAIDADTQTPEADQPSPFDYNPSEEISEDLPVSFPVDI